ncbi:MAG: polysaccharide pyruvyl transferase family protein [Opitutaceae bacterium]|nr:polysaccharide pyruvyl transferase family protein [Opitutaceae bacterium]
MKATFITTVRHNIGDDFVREGIIHLLMKTVRPSGVEVQLIHKHFPASARPEWEWLHRSGGTRLFDYLPGLRALRLSRWIERLPLRPATDKILNADLVVQSGAPVYWLNDGSDSSKNEWYEPLIRRRWLLVRDRVPLLNLGAGACQSFNSDGSEFERVPAVMEFIRAFHASCVLTTVRDQLSQRILARAGISAALLPCPALLATRRYGIASSREGSYVALNFMRLGGHYQLDEADYAPTWRDQFSVFARRLVKTTRCLMVCHSRAELEAAKQMLPEIERFYSPDYRDYLRIYAAASAGVVNRVHGAFALAGCGRPSLVVGNDSRARMAEIIGLPVLHVAEATTARMETRLEELRSDLPGHRTRLLHTADEAEQAYLKLLRPALAARPMSRETP